MTGLSSRWSVHWVVVTGLSSRWSVHRVVVTGLSSRWSVHRVVVTGLSSRWSVHRVVVTGLSSRRSAHRVVVTGLSSRWSVHWVAGVWRSSHSLLITATYASDAPGHNELGSPPVLPFQRLNSQFLFLIRFLLRRRCLLLFFISIVVVLLLLLYVCCCCCLFVCLFVVVFLRFRPIHLHFPITLFNYSPKREYDYPYAGVEEVGCKISRGVPTVIQATG